MVLSSFVFFAAIHGCCLYYFEGKLVVFPVDQLKICSAVTFPTTLLKFTFLKWDFLFKKQS